MVDVAEYSLECQNELVGFMSQNYFYEQDKLMCDIEIENMRELVQKHSEFETALDLECVLGTLVDNPVYEFFHDRLKLEGKENIRQFYLEHFNSFFPLIKSHVPISERWDENSACLEYDLYLKPPYRESAYRIMVVLTKKDSLLVGERFYVETELAMLMAGESFSKFTKF